MKFQRFLVVYYDNLVKMVKYPEGKVASFNTPQEAFAARDDLQSSY
jgi:hypothetical protein